MTNSEMIINIIKTRRNTKKFKDTEGSNEIIESLLDSAIWAPNHRSTEPWRFFVIQKSSTFRSKLTEHMIKEKESISNDAGKYEEVSEEEINRIKLTVADNPVLIFVFSTTDENPEITEENYAATCCAIQNLQLAAHSLNLGVGWSTGNMAKLKNLDQLFNFNQPMKMVGVLTVGYPSMILEKKRKDLDTVTKWL